MVMLNADNESWQNYCMDLVASESTVFEMVSKIWSDFHL